MLVITEHKGFFIKFANDYTASIQFGPHNYCENKYFNGEKDPKNCHRWESPNAEVAAINPSGKFVRIKGMMAHDDVEGYLNPDDVLKFLNAVANL